MSVPALLTISFCFLIIGATGFRRGINLYGLKASLVPGLFLALSALPFAFVSSLVALKAGGIGG